MGMDLTRAVMAGVVVGGRVVEVVIVVAVVGVVVVVAFVVAGVVALRLWYPGCSGSSTASGHVGRRGRDR